MQNTRRACRDNTQLESLRGCRLGDGPQIPSNDDAHCVALTTRAAEAVRALMIRERLPILRASALGGGPSGWGFGLSLTAATEEGDLVYETLGVTLCIDPDSVALIGGTMVDHDGDAFIFLRAGP